MSTRPVDTHWRRGTQEWNRCVCCLTLVAAAVLAWIGSFERVVAQDAQQGAITMRERVYEKLSRAQEAADAEDYTKAFQLLGEIERIRDLEPYEKAQLYTAYGFIFFSQSQYTQSISAYEKVLLQDDLPKALQASTLYTLAQLQFHVEEYEKAIDLLERWLATATNPGPEPLVLLGQAYYQLGRYREGAESVQRAIGIAQERGNPVKENWYLLMRAFHYELEEYPELLAVLEILVTEFPREQYWIDLAAAYGAMGDEDRRLAAYEIAYERGYLDRSRELLLLAQLLLQADVPYRAGVVLAKALEAGAVEATAENFRLLSQAWILSHENESAIEALTKASELSADGELDARLAQSYANLYEWDKTVEMARSALRKGVKDSHELQIMLGMALFELGQLDEAKKAFRIAAKSPESQAAASKWILYIEREQQRLRELQRSLQ